MKEKVVIDLSDGSFQKIYMNVPAEVIVPDMQDSMGCGGASACIEIKPTATVKFANSTFHELNPTEPIELGSLTKTYFVVTVADNPFKGFDLKVTKVIW